MDGREVTQRIADALTASEDSLFYVQDVDLTFDTVYVVYNEVVYSVGVEFIG